MREICAKRPWNLKSLVRRHRGETGALVHGWFPVFRFTGPDEWVFVPVSFEGGPMKLLSQSHTRTGWLPASPGAHRLHIGADQMVPEPHTYELTLLPGELVLVVFSTPRPSTSGRFAAPVFCEPVSLV